MGLITKKDVIRNITSLQEADDEADDEPGFPAFNPQEGGLLDGDEHRRSDDSS